MSPNNILRASLPLRGTSSLSRAIISSSSSSQSICSSSRAFSLLRSSTISKQTTQPSPPSRKQQRTLTTTPVFLQEQQQQSTTNTTTAAPSSTIHPPSNIPTTATTSSPTIQRKNPSTTRTGTVTSAGRMTKTVRVQHIAMEWDAHIRKYYKKKVTYNVADPRDSCREGDIIEFASGYRVAKTVRHVVARITVPFGVPLSERNPVMTPEEREVWFRGDKGQEYVGRIKRLVLERTGGAVP